MCSLRENIHEIVTVHSVHSNVAKIHSRLPIHAKTPRGIVVCEQ
jgi:hypothetical protein